VFPVVVKRLFDYCYQGLGLVSKMYFGLQRWLVAT